MRLPSAAMCGLQQQLPIRPCRPQSGRPLLELTGMGSNEFLRKPVGQDGPCRRLPEFSGALCGVLYLQKTCSKQACSLVGSSRLLAGTGFSSFPSLLDIRIGCCASSMLSTQYCTAHEVPNSPTVPVLQCTRWRYSLDCMHLTPHVIFRRSMMLMSSGCHLHLHDACCRHFF